jgi:hypothetical protein
MESLVRAILGPIVDWFNTLNIPEPIVLWGHPVMMGIVVLVMGTYAVVAGWRGRVATDKVAAQVDLAQHKKVVLWMFLFILLGYSGGIMSLMMQGEPIFESPHFWTGSIVIALLAINGLLSLTGFGGKAELRTAHAYLGTVAFGLLLLHGVLGLQLGLS